MKLDIFLAKTIPGPYFSRSRATTKERNMHDVTFELRIRYVPVDEDQQGCPPVLILSYSSNLQKVHSPKLKLLTLYYYHLYYYLHYYLPYTWNNLFFYEINETV